jgi:hypothetical protein
MNLQDKRIADFVQVCVERTTAEGEFAVAEFRQIATEPPNFSELELPELLLTVAGELLTRGFRIVGANDHYGGWTVLPQFDGKTATESARQLVFKERALAEDREWYFWFVPADRVGNENKGSK